MVATQEAPHPLTAAANFKDYYKAHPNLPKLLRQNDAQVSETARLMELLSEGDIHWIDVNNATEFIPHDSSLGGLARVYSYAEIDELRLIAGSADLGPFHSYLLRMFMINRNALKEGQYPAVVRASQLGEQLPWRGLQPEGGINNLFKRLGWVATYEINNTARDRRFDLVVNHPGREPVKESYVELPRFSANSQPFMVIGRVPLARKF
jgi:hypothetical protein